MMGPQIPASALAAVGIGLVILGMAAPLGLLWLEARPYQGAERGSEVGPLRPEMVLVPGGTFLMGSPDGEAGRRVDEVQHPVELSPFLIAATEVTQGQYRALMGENPSSPELQGVNLLGDDLPVQNVTWLDAIRYCNRLSAVEGLEPAYIVDGEQVEWNRGSPGYRLPTEAEWEYAARAGTTGVWGATSDPKEVCGYGNVGDRAFGMSVGAPCHDGFTGLAPVGQFPPNPWGLQDMTGNVWEWVWDWYGDYPTAAVTDPIGPSAGSFRVFRSGSCWDSPAWARVANRDGWRPSSRDDFLGFRPLRSLPSAL